MTQAQGSADVRYAPPQAHVDDIEVPVEGLQPADRLQRFWASMIDVGVAMVLMAAAAFLTPWNPWDPGAASTLVGFATNAAFGFLMFCVLHGWLLAKRGQTVGKAVLKMRIVRRDGSPAGLGRLLGLRYGVGFVVASIPAVGWLYGVVDALFIFNNERRCLHDLIADTIVVRA